MSIGARPLLETVQGLLERTYAMKVRLGDLAPFVIGDEGYRSLYGGVQLEVRAIGAEMASARTLLRETDEGLRACIYYPDALIRTLELHPPQRGLGDANVDAFATLVEELDHLLVIAERAVLGRPCSRFELELHANVSKHLVLARFLAKGRRSPLPARRRIWIRYHLFHKCGWNDPDSEVRIRYRDAAQWALRFLEGLDRVRAAERRIAILRRFHDAPPGRAIDLIRSMRDDA